MLAPSPMTVSKAYVMPEAIAKYTPALYTPRHAILIGSLKASQINRSCCILLVPCSG